MLLSQDTPIGTEFSGEPRRLTQKSLNSLLAQAFGSRLPANVAIHTNRRFAMSLGFAAPAVPSAITGAYLTGLMIDLFGEGWLSHGRMNLKFISSVKPGDTILPRARLRERQPTVSAVDMGLDVWCENQHRQTVITGQASGSIPLP